MSAVSRWQGLAAYLQARGASGGSSARPFGGLALEAETGNRGPGWAALVGLVAVALVIYAGSCWWFPYGHCLKCKGAGRLARKDGKVFRMCPRCKATGRRLRVGRKLWNWAHARKRGAR